MLFAVSVVAVACLVVQQATWGAAWAQAVSIAIGLMLIILMMYIGSFIVAWTIGSIFRLGRRVPQAASPFVNPVEPPRQVIPPQEQSNT